MWRYQVVGFDLDATLIWGDGFHYSWRRIWDYLGLDPETHRQMMRLYLDHQVTYQAWCKWVCGQFIERVWLKPAGRVGSRVPPVEERVAVYFIGSDEPYAPEPIVGDRETLEILHAAHS